MSNLWLPSDAFMQGVKIIIDRNFTPEIANRFLVKYEVDKAKKFDYADVYSQITGKSARVLEVYYQEGDATEYICDIKESMPPKIAQAVLLRFVLDKRNAGVIGKDWDRLNLEGNRITLQKGVSQSNAKSA